MSAYVTGTVGSPPATPTDHDAVQRTPATASVHSAIERRDRRRRTELRALAMAAAEYFADAAADEVIAWAVRSFGRDLAVASSMTDAVIPHLVSRHAPGVDVLFLDTGFHFRETLATRDEVQRRLDLTVVDVSPTQTVAEQDAAEGRQLFRTDPGRCCALRKVAPLNEQLARYEAWVSGVRHADGGSRRNARIVEWDEPRGLVKINPIVAWTDDEVGTYIAANDVIVNPLVGQGFPSIGCYPCTQAVQPGDEARAGRWAGTEKTECGIHQ